MSFFVHILRSKATGRYYVGHTEDLQRRISQHNDPSYHGSKHTKRNEGPWTCVYSEQYDARSAAMRREREIKSRKSRSFLELLISRQSPESFRD